MGNLFYIYTLKSPFYYINGGVKFIRRYFQDVSSDMFSENKICISYLHVLT